MRPSFGLSPSLVISILALTIALGGTSYAAFSLPAGSVGTPQLRNRAVTESKIRRHTLLVSDFKPGQLSSGGAVQGPPGPRGPQGGSSPQGPAGTARAYGVVSAAGVLDSARSKNIAAVTNPSNGIFCITLSGVNPASTTLVVVPDEANKTGESREIAHVDTSAPECPSGALEVVTRRIEYAAATQAITAFHHDNGFSFVVP